jgi:thiamine pyrophosphokinase
LIAGVLGGRLDHQLAALGACAGASDRLLQVVFDEDTVVWIGGTGSVIEVGRYLELGQTFSTIALGSPAVVSETGVEWELCDARLGPLDPRGISNVVRSANARVATGEGAIALIVPLGLTVPISQAATRRATGI